jgi:hypothetical protein
LRLFKSYKFYPKEEIERLANGLLTQMQATPNFAPKWPFDAGRVADFLDLAIVWDTIPADDVGQIAARILPLERLIEINEDILELPEGFEASTIAHEIGHWVLHINQDVVDRIAEQAELGIETSVKPFLCRSYNNQLEKIEWQAQYFASCLLMPRHILEEKRVGRDLTNWRHLYAIANELGVTISNLTNRLQDLSWICIPPGSRQIYLGEAAASSQKKWTVG